MGSVPTVPCVSLKIVKNITKKVLTRILLCAIIYKSPRYGGARTLKTEHKNLFKKANVRVRFI